MKAGIRRGMVQPEVATARKALRPCWWTRMSSAWGPAAEQPLGGHGGHRAPCGSRTSATPRDGRGRSRMTWQLFRAAASHRVSHECEQSIASSRAAVQSMGARLRRSMRSAPLGARTSAPMPAAAGQQGMGGTAGSTSARRFYCARCGTEGVVCSVCDRGRRYCSSECSLLARRASLRRAGCRYQSSRAGRVAHALRARCYRQRQRWGQAASTRLEPVLPTPEPVLAPPPPPPPPPPPSPRSPPNTVTHQSSPTAQRGDVLAAKPDDLVEQPAPANWHCGWCARRGGGRLRSEFLGRGRWARPQGPGRRRGACHGAAS